jgi:hypothetical protein
MTHDRTYAQGASMKIDSHTFAYLYSHGINVEVSSYASNEYAIALQECSDGEVIYILSPESFYKYNKFKNDMDVNYPLLSALR